MSLIVVGAAMVAWAAYWSLQPPPAPFEMIAAPADALADFAGLGVESSKLERLEVRAPAIRTLLASGIVVRGADGGPTPLSWRNAVTEPVFFADIAPAEAAKVLSAIRDHVPADAVVLSWWDMSRRIREIAKRNAPLDDPLARGLSIPSAWAATAARIEEKPRAFWGAGVAAGESETFAKFIDALLSDEKRGAAALADLAGGREAYVAVHLSDIWKTAAARPALVSIAYRDFAGGGSSHGVMKAAREWMREQKIEGGFAVEAMGAAIRLHYLPRKADSERLLARLLPFSTSNPAAMERLQLVYQYKGYWIYKLNVAKH